MFGISLADSGRGQIMTDDKKGSQRGHTTEKEKSRCVRGQVWPPQLDEVRTLGFGSFGMMDVS